MTRKTLTILPCAVALLLTLTGTTAAQSPLAAAPTSGTIAGTVLDARGHPASGVVVTARSVGNSASRARMQAVSNADGVFTLGFCPFGTYLVVASSTTGAQLAQTSSPQRPTFTVTSLSRAVPSATITLQTGRSTSILTGTVSDAATGKPVAAIVELRSATTGNQWAVEGVPSKFWIVAPNSALSMTVSAPGYQTWYYPGTSSPAAASPLNIGRKQQAVVDVQLQPLPK